MPGHNIVNEHNGSYYDDDNDHLGSAELWNHKGPNHPKLQVNHHDPWSLQLQGNQQGFLLRDPQSMDQ